MDEKKKGPLSKLFSSRNGGEKKMLGGRLPYIVGVGIIAATLIIGTNWFSQTKEEIAPTATMFSESKEDVPTFSKGTDPKTITSYEDRYEDELKAALEDISGVSSVTVVVNLESTERQVVEKNVVTQHQSTDETDPQGGKRTIENQSIDEKVVLVRGGDGEKPLVIGVEKPEIRGVLVVAKGAENINIKQQIIEAVTRVCDVPSHRVSVLPKKK